LNELPMAGVAPVPPLLATGEIELLGRMPWSSNATFLAKVVGPAGSSPAEHLAIYKPRAGERELWDFPDGLFRRERAAYVLSEALGWALVPPTVLRDGPHGEGSLQLFVEHDPEQHYFPLVESGDEDLLDQFRRLCAFDIVCNNTDRKSGHCLLDADRHIWAIDNGLAFHAEFKLRTVIWDFAGDELPPAIADDLCALLDAGLPPALAELLDPFERDAVRTRARALLLDRHFPVDPTGRRWPWPLV
jgi:uncharacterized repeat protein (TIGR03843 family)